MKNRSFEGLSPTAYLVDLFFYTGRWHGDEERFGEVSSESTGWCYQNAGTAYTWRRLNHMHLNRLLYREEFNLRTVVIPSEIASKTQGRQN